MPALVRVDGSQRPSKRQKIDPPGHTAPRASRIFAPFRTVGLVSPTPIPFTAQPLGKTSFHLTTSAGRCLQTYDLRRGLNLVFITRPQTPGLVTAVASWTDKVLAAWSVGEANGPPAIWVFKRGKKTDELHPPADIKEDIVEIKVFGSWIVACCATAIHVWKADTFEYYTTLWSPFASAEDAVLTGGIATMPTYTNKIFAGRADGSVEIWNVSTGRLLYRVSSPDSSAGPVSALQPAPALSLMAIAYANGLVVIHDILADREVLRLRAGTDETGPITSISFRTDGLGAGHDGQETGIMATASFNRGDVTFWDLNEGGRRVGVLRGAHDSSGDSGISKIEFLPGQAVLVTSGADNALKSWIFDHTPSSTLPRLLHSRSGHSAAITTLKFVPTDADDADSTGKWLLSTSKDRSLWGWSLRKDGQSTELSQGAIQKKAKKKGLLIRETEEQSGSAQGLKAPEITCIACSLNRDGGMGAVPGDRTIWASAKQMKGKSSAVDPNLTGWESVVTGHAGDKNARTWFWGRKRAGRWLLETGDGAEVKSVAMSPCGTFAVIGSAQGGIDMYNLQSGRHRQRFPPRLSVAQARKRELAKSTSGGHDAGVWAKGLGKHTRAVTGVEVDSLNEHVISCSLDGHVKFWDFLTGQLQHELNWHASVSLLGMKLHRPSGLLAVSCSDLCLRVVDIETRNTVRELRGPTAPVADWCFSNDGRWLVAGAADGAVRVWDLPTGHLIDAFRLPRPCTALAFSDTGEFLATAQQHAVGIDLWTNRAMFKHIPTRPLSEADIAAAIAGPAPSDRGVSGGEHMLAAALDDDKPTTGDNDEDDDSAAPRPALDQLSRDVATLSLVPRARWQTLLHLDAVRQRNKPVEPPKAPASAPFFLPSLPSAGGTDATSAGAATDPPPDNDRSRILAMERSGSGASTSRFAALLRAAAMAGEAGSDDETAAFVEHAKGLAPAQADIAIRSLAGGERAWFVGALAARLRARRDYELVQAWTAVFLRCHGEAVAAAARGEEGAEDEPLVAALRAWRREQRQEAERLGALAAYCAGVVGFLRSAR